MSPEVLKASRNENPNKNNLSNDLLEIMNFPIPYKHYSQHTSSGCGISSFLMIRSLLDKGYVPNYNDELFRDKKLRHMHGGIPIFEIIKMIDSYHIDMNVFFSENINLLDDNDSLVKNYKKTIEYMKNKGVLHHTTCGITPNTIIGELNKGRFILINGLVGCIPHMRAIIGYNSDGLIIADPLNTKYEIYCDEDFYNNCTPPFGRRFISLQK